MINEPLLQVRAALLTSSNTVGVVASSQGGAEINKRIDSMMIDAVNRSVDLRPMVTRKPLDQLSYIWNLTTDFENSRVAFYSEGAAGTPQPSKRTQLFAVAKAIRSDYEVTNLHVAGSSSFYNAMEDEARNAVAALVIAEEKSYICGANTSAYGLTGAYDGLLDLMDSNAAYGSTSTVYGVARASARDELDVQVVHAAPTTTAALTLAHLDSAITSSDKRGVKGNKRMFFVSPERHDKINQLLQAQQRFMGTLELEGGFSVSTYKRIPVVSSRFMDKNGVTWNGTVRTESFADNALYLLDMDNIEFRVLDGVDATHVPITGADTSIRSDVQGGYFKTYGVFVMKRFDSQVIIDNLSAP